MTAQDGTALGVMAMRLSPGELGHFEREGYLRLPCRIPRLIHRGVTIPSPDRNPPARAFRSGVPIRLSVPLARQGATRFNHHR